MKRKKKVSDPFHVSIVLCTNTESHNSQIKRLLSIFSSPHSIERSKEPMILWHFPYRSSLSLYHSVACALTLNWIPLSWQKDWNGIPFTLHRIEIEASTQRERYFFLSISVLLLISIQPSGWLHCTKTQHVLFAFAILFRVFRLYILHISSGSFAFWMRNQLNLVNIGELSGNMLFVRRQMKFFSLQCRARLFYRLSVLHIFNSTNERSLGLPFTLSVNVHPWNLLQATQYLQSKQISYKMLWNEYGRFEILNCALLK